MKISRVISLFAFVQGSLMSGDAGVLYMIPRVEEAVSVKVHNPMP